MVLRKNIVFVGSRFNVLEQLIKMENIKDITIYALDESYLSKILRQKNIPFKSFILNDKRAFLNEILNLDFDMLISNGCPYILPIKLFRPEQILINIHPTYLPFLQGKTPINGVFYDNYNFYGATMHYMDEGIDTGDIIWQKKEGLTSDIDLGLLYHLSMKMEGTVFRVGWELLKQSRFNYIGTKQKGKSTYFNRNDEMRNIDFKIQEHSFILRAIKSFGIQTQGCFANISNAKYIIYDAEEIIHKPLLEDYKESMPGSLLMEYDGKLLVKSNTGIIKVSRFVKV